MFGTEHKIDPTDFLKTLANVESLMDNPAVPEWIRETLFDAHTYLSVLSTKNWSVSE